MEPRRAVRLWARADVPALDRLEIGLRGGAEIRAFGHVLADRPLRVLVGRTLPGAVRIAELRCTASAASLWRCSFDARIGGSVNGVD